MKITPLAQGTGVYGAADVGTPGRTASPDKIARAKAIAMGEKPATEVIQDAQVQRTQNAIKKIKMRTQVSTNREEPIPVIEPVQEENVPHGTEDNPTPDTNEEAPAAEETQQLSPQLAALAKTKRALQVKERELAQREAQLAAQPQAPNLEDYVSKADLKSNPLKIFETGVTYDQLTEAILNNPTAGSSEIASLKSDIQDLKKALDEKFQERDQLSEKQVLTQMQRETELLTAQGEEFEAIREKKAQKHVVDLIHRTWKESGEVLDVMDAAKLVEEQIIEDEMPFAKLKKIQSRLNPAQEEVEEPQIAYVPKPGTKIMRTLTNRDSARPTAQDKRSRAIAAFWNGQLKRG